MKIIIRNRPFLFISQVLLASYLPAQFNNAHAATAALTEAPPPWAARQDASLSAAPSTEAAVSTTQQAAAAGASSMEEWYAKRQGYAAQAAQQVKATTPALQAKATQGDLNAQYALALQLRQDPSPENIAKSLKLQEKAARAGHVEAQYGLGVMYSNGQYVAQDQRLANFWLGHAAKRGSEAAKLALAGTPDNTATSAPVSAAVAQAAEATNTAYEQSADVVATNESMLPASEPEQSAAPMMSAEEYAALEQPAAEAATPEAQIAQPAARPAAPRQARRVAAPTPQVAQAPVEVAPQESELPAEGAAGAEGAPEAEVAQAEPEADPNDISVEHNESKVDLGTMSVQQVIDTAQKGDMYAQLMLGALFEDGTDPAIPQNVAEAAKWYAKAAKQGYPKAQHNLALLYEDGRGVKQSYTEAAKWYSKAAKAGFSEAQNNLAVLYIMGNGVKPDRAQAEKLLTAAVAQGNENARRNLQKLLEGAAS